MEKNGGFTSKSIQAMYILLRIQDLVEEAEDKDESSIFLVNLYWRYIQLLDQDAELRRIVFENLTRLGYTIEESTNIESTFLLWKKQTRKEI